MPDDLFCSFVVSWVLFSPDLVKQWGYRAQGQENFHGFSLDSQWIIRPWDLTFRTSWEGWTIPFGGRTIPLGENYPFNYHSACDTRILKVVKSFLLDGPPFLPLLLFPLLSILSFSFSLLPRRLSPHDPFPVFSFARPCPPASGSAG